MPLVSGRIGRPYELTPPVVPVRTRATSSPSVMNSSMAEVFCTKVRAPSRITCVGIRDLDVRPAALCERLQSLGRIWA